MAFFETMRKELTRLFSDESVSAPSGPQRVFLVTQPWSWGRTKRFHFIRSSSLDAVGKMIPKASHSSEQPSIEEIIIYGSTHSYEAVENKRALIDKARSLSAQQREAIGLTQEKILEIERELSVIAAEGVDTAILSTLYPVVKETQVPGSDDRGDWVDIHLGIAAIFPNIEDAHLWADRLNQKNTGDGKYVVHTYPVWKTYKQSLDHYAAEKKAQEEKWRQDREAAQKAETLAQFTPEECAALNITGGAAVASAPAVSAAPEPNNAGKLTDFEQVVASLQGRNPGEPTPRI